MIEPSRRQHRFEVPQIRDIGRITVIFSRHYFIDTTTERTETTEKGSMTSRSRLNRIPLG
jgi:hypothetical protein